LLDAGAEPPFWEETIQGVVSISHGLTRIVHSDLGFHCGGSSLDAATRKDMLKHMGVEVARAKQLLAFLETVRGELLPQSGLPRDVFELEALIEGECEQEVTFSGSTSQHRNFLLAAAHGGHCWALAELAHAGTPWPNPTPGGLSLEAVQSAAAALEERARAVVLMAEVRMAVLRGDVDGLRRFFPCGAWSVGSDGSGGTRAVRQLSKSSLRARRDMGWSEGVLITAARCGASAEIAEVLLSSTRLDPNLGRYEYKGDRCFELFSTLGWLASCSSSSSPGCPRGDTSKLLMERLAGRPGADLEFGCLSGSQSRAECRLETPAFRCRQAGNWHGLLCLMRAGAPIPTCGEGGSASRGGGGWGQVDHFAPAFGKGPTDWLDSLEQDLTRQRELTAQSLNPAPTSTRPPPPSLEEEERRRQMEVQLAASQRLARWLSQVRRPDFVFSALGAYPSSFREAAIALHRGWVQQPPRGLCSPLPRRSLEKILSFLGFWDVPAGRPSYIGGLRLRRIDGQHVRTGGYAGCPVEQWELLLSDVQFRLGDWAESVYRARGST